jgi:hypothetical protein
MASTVFGGSIAAGLGAYMTFVFYRGVAVF